MNHGDNGTHVTRVGGSTNATRLAPSSRRRTPRASVSPLPGCDERLRRLHQSPPRPPHRLGSFSERWRKRPGRVRPLQACVGIVSTGGTGECQRPRILVDYLRPFLDPSRWPSLARHGEQNTWGGRKGGPGAGGAGGGGELARPRRVSHQQQGEGGRQTQR